MFELVIYTDLKLHKVPERRQTDTEKDKQKVFSQKISLFYY